MRPVHNRADRLGPETLSLSSLDTSLLTVVAQISSKSTTAWGSWDKYMVDRKSVAQPSSDEISMFKSIGQSISASVAGFKPKHTASGSSEAKVVHVEKVGGPRSCRFDCWSSPHPVVTRWLSLHSLLISTISLRHRLS